jgi:transposase
MIALPAGTHIWVACGVTDMRKGFDTLAMVAQEVVKQSPRSGHVFVFRGKSGPIEDFMVGRNGLVSLRQAHGARPVRVAGDSRRSGSIDGRTIVDAV